MPGRERVVVVSHGLWQRQLGGARDAIGKTLVDRRTPAHGCRVLPPDVSRGIFRTIDAVTPIVLDRERASRDDRRLYVTAVLKPGIGIEQAEADLITVARQLQSDYPVTNAKTGVVVRPLLELLGANINAVVYLLSAVAIIVFGIACANVSSIILAHASSRRRELAVRWHRRGPRTADPAVHDREPRYLDRRGRGGFDSRLVGNDCHSLCQHEHRRLRRDGLNGRVLAASVALSVLAPLGFALLPALRMSRPDMDELRQGNRGAESTKGRRLRESLVVAQVALALILMTQVGLIGRTTWKLHHLEKGFDPAQVLTLRMNLAESAYRDLAAARDFYARALDRIQAVPGVASAGSINALPFADREVNVRFSIQGRPAPLPDSQPQAARAGISADYLEDDARADRARPWTCSHRLLERHARRRRDTGSRSPLLARRRSDRPAHCLRGRREGMVRSGGRGRRRQELECRIWSHAAGVRAQLVAS